jgi:hypothetical protein
MGGGDSGGGSPQFNAGQVAQQQSQQNVKTAIGQSYLNNVNQVTPYGSLTYTPDYNDSMIIDGYGIPRWTAQQTLTPVGQQLFDKQTGLQNQALDVAKGVAGQVQNAVSTPLNFDNLPAMPTDQTAARNQAYDALTARSNQALDLQEQQMRTRLANQGISAGTEAWNNEFRPLEQARVDASNQATIDAGNLAGQNIQQAQTLRNQGIQETEALRNQPFQDYSALMGFGGSVQQPNFVTTPQTQIQPADVTSPYIAQYQGQLNAYNQNRASSNAMMGGMFGLGGSILGGIGRMLPFGSQAIPGYAPGRAY